MLGGNDAPWCPLTSVCTCSVSALLQSCVPSSLKAKVKVVPNPVVLFPPPSRTPGYEAKVEGTSLVEKASVWRQDADLPVTLSTWESFHGRLLAIGGNNDDLTHKSCSHVQLG